MKRPVLICTGIFAVIFLGAVLVIERGNGWAAPKPPVPEFKLARNDDAKPEPAPKDAKADDKTAEKQAPKQNVLFLKRWAMPPEIQAPDRPNGIYVFIDPVGPKVIGQTKSSTLVWDATTGETKPGSRVEPTVSIQAGLHDGRGAIWISDAKTKQQLLFLKEVPTRLAYRTPDGRRLVVVTTPSVYPRYYTVNPTKGVEWHEGHFQQNVRVYKIGGNDPLGAFCPREFGQDDDVWAVAVAPDGKSIFLATKEFLDEISFSRAFHANPLPPETK